MRDRKEFLPRGSRTRVLLRVQEALRNAGKPPLDDDELSQILHATYRPRIFVNEWVSRVCDRLKLR